MKKLLRSVACGLLGVVIMREPVPAQRSDPASVRSALSALANDERAFKTLTVSYDDLHGLHGGLTLTLHGDGRIEQKAVREKAGQPKDAVDRADLQRLVALLLELQAWEQRVPERPPVPDESRAYLRITLNGHSSSIWEWYNDLTRNQRLIRVRELMKKLAWRKT